MAQTVGMAFDTDRLLRLWSDPLPDADTEAQRRFRELYTDPVAINGTAMPLDQLLERARSMQRAYADTYREVLSTVEHGDKVAVAFRFGGRQVGPVTTALGTVPPTGRSVDVRTIDILTFTDGRISEVWVVSEELALLTQLHAVEFVDPGT